jgi:hypothetical protein
MPGVCVGCGLRVIGGALHIEGGGACGEEDLGVLCSDEGGLDLVTPMLGLRVDGGLQRETAFIPSAGFDGVVISGAEFHLTHDSGSGVLEHQSGGAIEIMCEGVYTMFLTGGSQISEADAPSKRHLGGRVRLLRNGIIIASEGVIAYDDASIDFTSFSGIDGPEWSCGTVQPLSAGQLITWEVVTVTNDPGATILYPQVVNSLTIARLGRLR